ncbi:MAG: hypothetical protein ACJAVF_002225, partial [Paraglaciecola sp.]
SSVGRFVAMQRYGVLIFFNQLLKYCLINRGLDQIGEKLLRNNRDFIYYQISKTKNLE